MILDKEIKIRITPRILSHYLRLGYNTNLNMDIIIIPEHLPRNSTIKVKVKCDYSECKKEKELIYNAYLKNTKNFTVPYTCSPKCAHDIGKNKKTKLERYGDENYNNIEKQKERFKNKSEKEKQEIFNKISKTHLNRNEKEIIESNIKREKTNLKRYKVKYPSQMESFKKIMKNKRDNGSYDNVIPKTKKTKLENHGDENYNNREKFKQTCLVRYDVENPMFNEKIIKKMIENQTGMIYDEYIEQLPDFVRYRIEVWKFTRKQPLHTLKNIEKRKRDEYWLDHKYSIKEGFKQNIPPYILGNIINLEMLPWKDNKSKHDKCSITEEVLFKLFDDRG